MTIHVKNSLEGVPRATQTFVSESDGFYTVVFDPNDWGVGDIALVVAQFGGATGSNYTCLDESVPVFYVDVVCPFVQIQFELGLKKGWNFVSIPFVNHAYNASSIGLQKFDVVVRWDPLSKTYDETFVVGVSPLSYDFAFLPSTGYWIYKSVNQTITLNGPVPATTQTRHLEVSETGGWANIAFCTLNATWKASSIPAKFAGGSIAAVAYFNPDTQLYRTYIPGVPPSDFVLKPGAAYWCFCSGSGTLTYDP